MGYARLATLLAERAGLHFAPNRQPAAEAAMRRVLHDLRLDGPLELARRAAHDADALDRLLAEVTIGETYFFREPAQLDVVRDQVLPDFRDRRSPARPLRVWGAGCASGEEPYTIALLAHDAEILATDVDPAVLGRAQAARYAPSSLRELPAALRDGAFGEDGVLAPRIRRRVTLMHHDIRDEPPAGPFDLVLCRNLAFTYFDDAAQRATLRRIASVTAPGGALVVGAHEELPAGQTDFEPWAPQHGVFRVH
jgi:chemotaxis protein methyltransferase CheR